MAKVSNRRQAFVLHLSSSGALISSRQSSGSLKVFLPNETRTTAKKVAKFNRRNAYDESPEFGTAEIPESACREVEDVKEELVIQGLSDVASAPVAWDDERRLAANRGDLRIIPLLPNGFGISWKASTIIRSVAERYKKVECCCLRLLSINNNIYIYNKNSPFFLTTLHQPNLFSTFPHKLHNGFRQERYGR